MITELQNQLLQSIKEGRVNDVKSIVLGVDDENERRKLVNTIYYEYAEDETTYKGDKSALYYAARNGSVEICDFLLKNGADARVGLMHPVIYGAIEGGSPEVFDLLVEAGSSRTRTSPLFKQSPKDFAISTRNNDIIARFDDIKSPERKPKHDLKTEGEGRIGEEVPLINNRSPSPGARPTFIGSILGVLGVPTKDKMI